MQEKIVYINGKRIVLPVGTTTVGEARPYLGIPESDILVEARSGSARPLEVSDEVPADVHLTSFPQISKGGATAAPSPWVQRDLEMLQSELGRRHPVETRQVVRDGNAYMAVVVENVQMNMEKFGTSRAKLLFMLPADYPAIPPIGVYVDHPYKARDHHFHLRTYYGAPDLQDAGFYWYCLIPPKDGSWRPGANPADGHNLTSLVAQARHAINTH